MFGLSEILNLSLLPHSLTTMVLHQYSKIPTFTILCMSCWSRAGLSQSILWLNFFQTATTFVFILVIQPLIVLHLLNHILIQCWNASLSQDMNLMTSLVGSLQCFWQVTDCSDRWPWNSCSTSWAGWRAISWTLVSSCSFIHVSQHCTTAIGYTQQSSTCCWSYWWTAPLILQSRSAEGDTSVSIFVFAWWSQSPASDWSGWPVYLCEGFWRCTLSLCIPHQMATSKVAH